MSERPITADYRKAVDVEEGDLMTVEEYLEIVASGEIEDSDGMGSPVKGGKEAFAEVDETGWPAWLRPSDGISKIPLDATHVIWFNR